MGKYPGTHNSGTKKRRNRTFKDNIALFYEKYEEFLKDKDTNPEGRNPGITEFSHYSGICYPTLLNNVLKPLERRGKIRYNKRYGEGKVKEIEVLDGNFQDNEVDGEIFGSGKSNAQETGGLVNSDGISNFLSNAYVENYIRSLNLDVKNATRIFGVIGAKSMIDESVAETSKIELSQTRRYLTKLYEIGAVSLERKRDPQSGWFTYFWKVDANNMENLRNSCISNIRMGIEKKESELRGLENGKYVCGKFNGSHPVLDFGSDELEETGYRCKGCGNPLVFKTEGELKAPIENEIARFEKAIEEVKNIILTNKTGAKA